MKNLRERLYEKIDMRGPDECWPWLAYCHKGYGTITVNIGPKKNVKQHAIRVAYELENGPIPLGMEIDHTCCNRICCNPRHGEIVTHAENMKRAWSGGRMKTARKIACPAFITVVLVDPRLQRVRAEVYGVPISTIEKWIAHYRKKHGVSPSPFIAVYAS